MDCPEPAVLEAVARGEVDPWPPGLEEHLDGCPACLQQLVDAGARAPAQPPAPESTDRALPELVEGRYEFIGELGRGGQSRVLRAYDRLLRHDVAFKQFVPRTSEPATERVAQSRFVREIGLMADLAHPGVIPILDLGLHEQWPYCTMQVVEGQTLTEARADVGDDAAGVDRLLGHFVEVCETIGFAHRLGIVHRDIKPDNVMLGSFGQTYVLDWALAKRLTGDDGLAPTLQQPADDLDPWVTEAGEHVGTPAYMSPEHLGTRVDTDPASDVWSLGAVLYFVATGRATFEANTLEDALAAIRRTHRDGLSASQLAGVPRELAAIIARAMTPAREQRYPTARAIAADVEAYRTDRPVSVVHYTAWQRLARSLRHHPALVAASTVVMLVATIGFITTWGALRRESRAREQAVDAFDRATEAREESERLALQARRRAAQVTVALAGAHADRAVQLRSDASVFSSRAEAARGVLALEGLDETLLGQDDDADLQRARARLRGELLVSGRDVVARYDGVRTRTPQRLKHVVRGGDAYAEWTDADAMVVRRVSDGSQIGIFEPEQGTVDAIALSASGTRAAVVVRREDEATIITWAPGEDHENRWIAPVASDGILAVADDGTVAANSPSDEVFVLRPGATKPRTLARLPNWGLALSADGERLALSGNGGELQVLDTRAGELAMACERHEHRLTALTFSPTARAVLAGCVSGHAVRCSEDGQSAAAAHASRVTAVTTSTDPDLSFTAGMDDHVSIGDASGSILARVDIPGGHAYNLSFDPERDELHAFTGAGVHTWVLRSDLVSPARREHKVRRQHDFDGHSILVPHGLEPLLVEVEASDGSARVLTIPSAQPPAHVHRHGGHLHTVSFSGVVSQLQRTGDRLDLVRSWDSGGRDVNASAMFGDLIAIEHKDPYGATLWDLDAGRQLHRLEGPTRAVFDLAFSPDGTQLATGDASGKVLVWNVSSGAQVGELRGTSGAVHDLAFTRGGGLVVASAGGLHVWPQLGAEPLALDPVHAHRLVAVDAVHHRVAASREDQALIGVWDLETARPALEFSAGIAVQDLVLSSDGQTLYWLSSRRMRQLTLPTHPADVDPWASGALHDARSERSVLIRSKR